MKKSAKILIIVVLVLLIVILSSIVTKNRSVTTQGIEENLQKNQETQSNNIQENQALSTEEASDNDEKNTTKIIYGESSQGRPLEAFLIKGDGSNTKIIFLDFEVHRL